MDIQDNVYLTPTDNRDDLIKRIVAVCEQIPPEFLLNAANERQWKVSNVP
jgi:hypothetical protein